MAPKSIYALLTTVLILSACASTPNLAEISPANINLSGTWLVNKSMSQPVILRADKKRSDKSRDKSRSGRGTGERGDRKSGSKADRKSSQRIDPTMVALELKIEQGTSGMGIAFPKGPYRDIDWGEHEIRNLKVKAGWDKNDNLIVISKNDRLSYAETYSLSESGDRLTIQFDIDGPSGAKKYIRVFDKQNSDS